LLFQSGRGSESGLKEFPVCHPSFESILFDFQTAAVKIAAQSLEQTAVGGHDGDVVGLGKNR